MKYVRFIVASIVTILVSCMIYYVLLLAGFNLLGSTWLFVIPLGGLIYGSVSSFVVALFCPKDNLDEKKAIVIAACLGVIVIFAASFTDYATCYIDDKGMDLFPNRLFKGDHISSYVIDDEFIDFARYIKYIYFESGSTIKIKGGSKIETSKQYNAIVYFLQYVGAILAPIYYLFLSPKAPTFDTAQRKDTLPPLKNVEVSTISDNNVVTDVEKEIPQKPIAVTDGHTSLSSSMFHKDKTEVSHEEHSKLEVYYCKMCGNPVEYGIKFCSKCGALQEWKEVPKDQSQVENDTLVQTNNVNENVTNTMKNETPIDQLFNNNEDVIERNDELDKLSHDQIYTNTRVCESCGKSIPYGGVYCPLCGARHKDCGDNKEIDDKAMDQLRKIKQLYDEGILTEEEYNSKKRQILKF